MRSPILKFTALGLMMLGVVVLGFSLHLFDAETAPTDAAPLPTVGVVFTPSPTPDNLHMADFALFQSSVPFPSEYLRMRQANVYPAELVARGQVVYAGACAPCHGVDGRGMPGYSKDLITGEFTRRLSDPEVFAFIQVGRAIDDPLNTTGIPMPPRGANPAISESDVVAVIAYLRTQQIQTLQLDSTYDPVLVNIGRVNYALACLACHGHDGHGMPGIGSPLMNSPIMLNYNDTELINFIHTGVSWRDPLRRSITGMLPDGGGPRMSDDDLIAIFHYLRSVQEEFVE